MRTLRRIAGRRRMRRYANNAALWRHYGHGNAEQITTLLAVQMFYVVRRTTTLQYLVVRCDDFNVNVTLGWRGEIPARQQLARYCNSFPIRVIDHLIYSLAQSNSRK